MKKIIFALAFLFLTGTLLGQLCSPTFSSGCFSWNTKSIMLGTINWEFDNVDCSAWDYTSTSTTLTAGTASAMNVSAGNWCGVSVWVDLNKDNLLDDTENLYHEGNGSTEVTDFTFSITIPATTVNGNYTLRVISSWGSDGFTPGANGNGGCGTYEYGNYQDFTIMVTGGMPGVGLDENSTTTFTLSPNPVNDFLNVLTEKTQDLTYNITAADGTLIARGQVDGSAISTANLQQGIYFLKLENSPEIQKFIKL